MLDHRDILVYLLGHGSVERALATTVLAVIYVTADSAFLQTPTLHAGIMCGFRAAVTESVPVCAYCQTAP